MPKRSRSSLMPPPSGHRIVGRQHHRRERGFDVRFTQYGLHTIGAQEAVAQFEHDHVRFAGRHFAEHGAGQGGTAFLRRGDDPKIGEDQRAAGPRIFERENVATQGDAGGLEGIDDEARDDACAQ